MIIQHQVKQYLQNNARFGENSRRDNKRLLFAGISPQPLMISALDQPDYSRNWGIDISGRWDGIVDLGVTKSKGASFVFMKGVDGTIQDHTYYPVNRYTAIDVDLPHGPYGWLYANRNVSCVAQAQSMDSFVQKYPHTLDVVVDFEWTRYGGVISNPNYSDLRLWAVEWRRLGNPKPILYSAKGFMDEYGPIPADLKDLFKGLWVANYGTRTPYMPMGYKPDEWIYWQFTEIGDSTKLAPNSKGTKEVDLDYGKGSGSVYPLPSPSIPPEKGDNMKRGTVRQTVSKLNIRDSRPGGTYRDIGDLFAGDVVVGEVVNGWIEFNEVTRKSGTVENIHGFAAVYDPNNPATIWIDVVDIGDGTPTPAGKPITIIVDLEGYKPKSIRETLEPQ